LHHLISIFLTLLIFLTGGNLAEGRRTARILPQGQREEMTYNTLGQLTAHKDFNGQTNSRNYDSTTSELLSIAAPSNHPSLSLNHAPARYDFTYDLLGRRIAATAKNKLGTLLSSETYQYDLRSQLTGYAGPTGSIGYGYDSAGNLAGAKSSTPGGYDVSYDYDALNRITMVHRGQEGIDPTSTQLAAYNYDANGNLNGTGYANGIQHAYTYNPQNRLTALNVSSISSSPISNPQSLQGYAYTLNKNGHRTQITELSGRVITNTFDKLHRLTREAITGSAPVSGASAGILPGVLSYSYDPVGNRTSRTTTGPVATIIPSQTQAFTVNDRLTTDTYDANGNTLVSKEGGTGVPPVSSSSVTDIYSFDNRLIRRTTPDGKTIDLTYNPDGHRLSKYITQNALTQRLVHYLTDANNPTGYAQVIEEKHPLEAAESQLKKVNLYGHDLISSLITDHSALITKPIFYQYDGLGSVRSVSNSTGDLQETYDYDAYGTLIGLNKRNLTTGVLESTLITDHSALITQSSYLFTGEQNDSDLGMYFLRARYLNTNTGRFHTQDTYEGDQGSPLSLHKYLYANGNPASYTDPSGNFALAVAGLAGSLTLDLGSRTVDLKRSVAIGGGILKAATIVGTAAAVAAIPYFLYQDQYGTQTRDGVEELVKSMRRNNPDHVFFAHGTSDTVWNGSFSNINETFGGGDFGPGFYTWKLPEGTFDAFEWAKAVGNGEGGSGLILIFSMPNFRWQTMSKQYLTPDQWNPLYHSQFNVLYGPLSGRTGLGTYQWKFQGGSTSALTFNAAIPVL
jgi:RHS repeat-associated protein